MKQIQALFGLLVIVVLAAPSTSAESFEGCGTFFRGVECVLFQADDGHVLLTGTDHLPSPDRFYLTGTVWSCMSICMQGNECLTVETIGPCPDPTCCVGKVGDINGNGGDIPTIGDLSALIEALFVVNDVTTLSCLAEADLNRSGGAAPLPGDISVGDVVSLIDYLFITGSGLGLPDCP